MKIVKFFVVFNLILSISLINSVAAISVSDGSAFVTKAEFAADLNNLSNRMSTLENSLDAKIDSLVSSYLSRNGIWNGELHKSKCASFDTDKNEKVIFDRITKSGLLMIPYEIKVDYKVGVYSVNTGDKSNESINRGFGSPVFHAMYINLWFYEKNGSNILSETQQTYFYGLTGQYGSSSNAAYRMVLDVTPKYNFITFVTKESSFSYKMNTKIDLSMDWWGIKIATSTDDNLNTSLGGKQAYKGSNNLQTNYSASSEYRISFKTDSNLYIY